MSCVSLVEAVDDAHSAGLQYRGGHNETWAA